MARKVLAVSILVVGLAVLVSAALAELEAANVREPIFATGVIFGAAFVVSCVLALAAYLLWPKAGGA